MKKIILIFIFSTILLHSQQTTSLCKTDLENMTTLYYKALKLKNQKMEKDSIKNFQQSIFFANTSLESCVNNSKYDFRVAYDYITSAEFEIQMIENR